MKKFLKNFLFIGIWLGIMALCLAITFEVIKSIYFLAAVSEFLPIIITALIINKYNNTRSMDLFMIIGLVLWKIFGMYSWQSWHIYFRSTIILTLGIYLWFLFRNKLKISIPIYKWLSVIIIALFFYYLEPILEQKLFDKQALQSINTKKFNFNFIALNRNKPSISKFESNQVYVLNLWTNSCGACVEEFPTIAKLRDKYKNNTNVHFIALNTNDSAEAIKKFTPIVPYNFDIYLDSGKSMFYKLNLRAVPYTLIFNKKGEIEKMMQGFNNKTENYFEDNLTEAIESALK